MTYNPVDLVGVRGYLSRTLGLSANELGIMGDPAHASSGGYHEGNDDLARVGQLTSDYSKRESPRDRPGTDGASALDIGFFDRIVSGRRVTLRSFSAGLVAACERGDPRARDIREVIWSPDGSVVRRWDRLGIRSTGSSSHLTHTHTSFFRDSEGRRDRDDNVFGLFRELLEGVDAMALDSADKAWLINNLPSAVRRGVWENGFVDATVDPAFRGGATLDSLNAQLNAIRATLGDVDAAVDLIVPAVATAIGTIHVDPLTDAQVDMFATKVAAALAAAPAVPLGQSNVDAIIGAVKTALRQGTDH